MVNSDRTKPSQNLMANILNKKSVVAKTFGVFSRNCRNQKFNFGPNQIRPFGWDCNRFCWVTHNCVTTVIFSCSYSMNFYNGFLGPTIWPPKNKFHWEFLWFFKSGSIQPLLALATWAEQSLLRVAATLNQATTTRTRLGLQQLRVCFFMLLAHKSSFYAFCAIFRPILVWYMSNFVHFQDNLMWNLMCLSWLQSFIWCVFHDLKKINMFK